MWKWPKFNRNSELEAELRSVRAQPRDEFVTQLAETVESRPAPRRAWSRLAFAGAVTTFILGTFASFGGLGYAASGSAGAYHTVKKVTTGHVFVTVHKSSAQDQYGPKPKPHKTHKTHPTVATGVAGVAGQQAAVNKGVKSSGTLPFTGLSLLATLLVSLALIASGIALRRGEAKSRAKS
jgi:hypothetical protein